VKDAEPSLAEGASLASRIAYHVNELQKNRAIYPAINGGLLNLPLKVYNTDNTPIYPILDGEMGYFVIKDNAKLEVLTDTTVDCILIAGGGGGGNGTSAPLAGGGGGAGGLLSVNAQELTKTSDPIEIIIGAGGTAGAAGGDTVINGVLTAVGGGKGGSNTTSASNGGSGGGAQGANSTTSRIGGTGTTSQGNAGGSNTGSVNRPGGSGGGGSNMNTDPEDENVILGVGVSRNAPSGSGDTLNKGTEGGQGYKLGELWAEFSEEISGIVDTVTDMIIPLDIPNSLAGGGSGGSTTAVTDPTLGTHGGGTGGYGTTAATGGKTNSGGGGGGGLGAASKNGGGAGGSGLCLIRFPLPQGAVRAIRDLETAYADVNLQDEAIVEKPVDIDMVAAALAANYVNILKSSAIEQLNDEDTEEIVMEAEMELDEILAVLTAVNEQL